ncbi:hypothetical protein AO385_1020 [Moraxella catarrhalis]|uniref:Uncharacterized protein n=1 Tax=Moraxella catarrhalis TaxID=480 RepID=A0A198UH77_MORCA|nr:hypothetical protein AO384_1357 [Moraxella catarrhalis]OAU96931.1 hypothetical protein AO383_1255 [Moraxella catarrhalis]OAU98627.1 hypothetical protein AO383_0555 [Moraxella catarrhalis]OAV01649.1 hypothetical protein AO385_1020 [Moraxella catarrhalis]OAV11476.1 hypothetical protein AO378_0306 [Moraxella catarrhalis]
MGTIEPIITKGERIFAAAKISPIISSNNEVLADVLLLGVCVVA